MNQIFIDTEVKRKCTNVIELGGSFSEYIEKLGYSRGKANQALLSQLINYVTSTIKVEPNNLDPGHFAGVKTLISTAWDIYFDYSNPNQLMLQKGKIILDEKYAKFIYKHAVPLDMNILRIFKNNATAIDFIRFLAYRNNKLKKKISFPEKDLFEQLGSEIKAHKVLRSRLRIILKQLQIYWPVEAGFNDGDFWMNPSPPIVPMKKLK